MPKSRSHLELEAEGILERLGVPFASEYRFDTDGRGWRFDFAFPEKKIAIEIEGGVWSGGRHTRGYGYKADIEKYNAAAMQGWKLNRFTADDLRSGKFEHDMRNILKIPQKENALYFVKFLNRR